MKHAAQTIGRGFGGLRNRPRRGFRTPGQPPFFRPLYSVLGWFQIPHDEVYRFKDGSLKLQWGRYKTFAKNGQAQLTRRMKVRRILQPRQETAFPTVL